MVHCRDFIGGNCRHAFNIYKIFWVPCMIVVSKYTPNKITPLIQLRYLKKKKEKTTYHLVSREFLSPICI